LVASGGKVNNTKRRIYGWNMSGASPGHDIKNIWFPTIGNWKHFKYLGMPIFLKSSHSQAWQDILDKIIARIQNWGAQWLNPMQVR
jgi:hypothetical protein